MAMKHPNDPIEPLTLGNMCANGVRSLDVSCWNCHHRAIMSADPWFGPRMVCTQCGIIGADARPNWRERPQGLTGCAMAMNSTAERRRALELLADAAQGCTEAIMLAHGFKIGLLVDLVRDGLATAETEIVHAGRQPIEVVRMHISPAGRRALAGAIWRL